MIITSFDPGTTKTGWCTLDTRGGGGTPITATYQEAGNVESTPAEIARILRDQKPDVVALEAIEGIAFAGKKGIVDALVSSSRVAGRIEGLAHLLGLALVPMTALQWRRLVLGRPSAEDAEIARVIPTLIHGWPARSNVHMRDAGGLALGVAWFLNGKAPTRFDRGLEIVQ